MEGGDKHQAGGSAPQRSFIFEEGGGERKKTHMQGHLVNTVICRRPVASSPPQLVKAIVLIRGGAGEANVLSGWAARRHGRRGERGVLTVY